MKCDRSFRMSSRLGFFAVVIGVFAWHGTTVSAALLYDPVVTQVGDGTNPLSGAGATTTIRVYDNTAPNQLAPLAQLAYGNGVLVNAGSSFSEGQLANNPGLADAATAGLPCAGTAYVFSAGYAASDGTAAVAGSAVEANRVVGDMTVSSGSVGTPNIVVSQPALNNAYAPNSANIRAAVGDDTATNVWTAGTSGLGGTAGYRYFNTNTQVENGSGPTNTRTIQIRQGQLYGSSDSSTYVGISLIGNGIPTTTGAAVTPLFVTGSSSSVSPEAFALIDDPNVSTPTLGTVNVPFNVAYIADTNTGIQKWVYSTSTTTNNGWSLAYTISDAPVGALDGYNGLAAELVQVPVIGAAGGLFTDDIVLFATNMDTVQGGGNSLQRFIDPLEGTSASAADASLITLASAPADDAFRGVALAPIPEPASMSLMGIAMLGLLKRHRRQLHCQMQSEVN